MTDDSVLCPTGLVALAYFLAKAVDYQGTFSTLRCGAGLEGFVVQNGVNGSGASGHDDALKLSVLLRLYNTRPVAQVVSDFVSGADSHIKAYLGTRSAMFFRYNIFRAASTKPSRRCFSNLQDFDRFPECGNDDVAPCWYLSARRPEVNFSVV
jgi:hypothetical protein